MARLILLVLVVFFLLTVLRGFLIFFRAVFPKAAPRPGTKAPPALESEMVRDPVCGTWLDPRLALTARRGGETVSVCSEDCRRQLEAAG